MSIDNYKVTATSDKSAIVEDIILDEIQLRENEKTRLIFRPQIVDNIHDASASVKGRFLFQRKGKNNSWDDYKTLDLSKLKKGEYIQLDLNTSEVKKLIDSLTHLYEIFPTFGIQGGTVEYLVEKREAIGILKNFQNDSELLTQFFALGGISILPQFVEWLSGFEDAETVVRKLQGLAATDLDKINNLLGIAKIHKVLDIWKNNSKNAREEFWQTTFMDNSWLISQLFATPMVIFKGKAHVGGKSINNSGGQIADFIYKNLLTSNISIVEIKTPCASIVSRSSYREGVYAVTEEVTGGVIQVLSQKKIY